MPIITISRGTYSSGDDLAELVAGKLGYRCVAEEFLNDASQEYDIPTEKLNKALVGKLRIRDRLSLKRMHRLALIGSTLCEQVKDEDVVYHGHAGHFLLKDVPHVLKVRLIAGMEYRINNAMLRHDVNRKDAKRLIEKLDDARIKWSNFLFGIDTRDPKLYDLILNVERLTLSGSCDVVCATAKLKRFHKTQESQERMHDAILAAKVRAAISSDTSIRNAQIKLKVKDKCVEIWGTVQYLEDADKIREIVLKQPCVEDIDTKFRVQY